MAKVKTLAAKGSVLSGIVAGLASKGEAKRHSAKKKLAALLEPLHDWRPNWTIPAKDAVQALAEAKTRTFVVKNEWDDPLDELIFGLIKSPHPELVEPITAFYAEGRPRARCAVLTVLAAVGTREAAQAVLLNIREHGWPASAYGRLFAELPKIIKFADLVLPELVTSAGTLQTRVIESVVAAAQTPGANASAIGKRLGPVAPVLEKRLNAALTKAEKRAAKAKAGTTAWRFSESYSSVRNECAALLSLLTFVDGAGSEPLLKRALGIDDPLLVLCAACGLLERGKKVPVGAWSYVASSDEQRAPLFQRLEAMKRVDVFPKRHRTWDAFAAAEMVSWLAYPTEMGREPDALEKKKEIEVPFKKGGGLLYVWRFRDGKKWMAGVSGPYPLADRKKKGAEPRPVWGPATFSVFDAWDSATPEGHAEKVLSTLGDWQKS